MSLKDPRAVAVLSPHWPTGVMPEERYRVLCDDKGQTEQAWFEVIVAPDGDVHVAAYCGVDLKGEPLTGEMPFNPFPTVRVRSFAGGGRNLHTRQALLWLAYAIQLDKEENGA